MKIEDTSGLSSGDWIELNLQNNDPARVAKELSPYPVQPEWKEINTKGVTVRVFHKIKSVGMNQITLADPIMYKVEAADNWS